MSITRDKLLNEDKHYAPYCCECSTMGRMSRTETGYICKGEGDYFLRKGCGFSFDLPKEFLDEYKKKHGIDFKDGGKVYV